MLCIVWAVLLTIGLLLVSNFNKTDAELELYHERQERLLPRSDTMTLEDKAENEAPLLSIIKS